MVPPVYVGLVVIKVTCSGAWPTRRLRNLQHLMWHHLQGLLVEDLF